MRQIVDRSGACTSEAERDAYFKGVEDVLYVRCLRHRNVPAYNQEVSKSGECPACEIETLKEMIGLAAEGRCMCCGWPLAVDANRGCVPGNCSYRPPKECGASWQKASAIQTEMLQRRKTGGPLVNAPEVTDAEQD